MSDTERIDAEEYSAKADEDTATEAEVLADEPKSEDTVGESDIAPATADVDYAELATEDMKYLISVFPHLEGKTSVAELDNPLRYAALRDLGLSPLEAYLATNYRHRQYDNRSHLQSAVPKPAAAQPNLLSSREMEAARELFADLSDREIQRLYKKVSK